MNTNSGQKHSVILTTLKWLLGIAVALAVYKVMSAEHTNWSKLIDALAQIESGGNREAIGPNGERGQWQMSKAAWDEVNRERAARNMRTYGWLRWADHEYQAPARSYANWYLGICRRRLATEIGREPVLREVYCVWNLGLEGYRKCRFTFGATPMATQDAAIRLENLMNK